MPAPLNRDHPSLSACALAPPSSPSTHVTAVRCCCFAAAGCRGDYNAALAAAVDALPLQTRASVIAHCRWHADLCKLDMRKWVLHCLGHNAASISIRSSQRLARPTLA